MYFLFNRVLWNPITRNTPTSTPPPSILLFHSIPIVSRVNIWMREDGRRWCRNGAVHDPRMYNETLYNQILYLYAFLCTRTHRPATALTRRHGIKWTDAAFCISLKRACKQRSNHNKDIQMIQRMVILKVGKIGSGFTF